MPNMLCAGQTGVLLSLLPPHRLSLNAHHAYPFNASSPLWTLNNRTGDGTVPSTVSIEGD